MKKKNIVMLLMGITKSGKTTIVGALSNTPNEVAELSSHSEARTQITTDWKFVPGAIKIQLSRIDFNLKAFFCKNGVETVKDYNEQLKNNYEYLHDVLGFEYKECLDEEIIEYVESMGKNIVELCKTDKNLLKNIVLKRKSAKFIRRIEVIVPPNNDFANFLNEKKLESFIARDTKGILDLKKEEDFKELGNLSCQDLGLDGIDAAMLLCQSTAFANACKEWYRNIYSTALDAVPVFISARYDGMIERWEDYKDDNEDEDINKFCSSIINNKKLFNRLVRTHLRNAFELLEDYGVMQYEEESQVDEINKWKFVYDYYEINKIAYFTPVVADLSSPGSMTLEELMEIPDSEYSFYRNVIFHNFKDAIEKICEYNKLLEVIAGADINGEIFDIFIESINEFDMYPKYRNYSRETVNQKIGDKTLPILGLRRGITTVSHGNIKYLAAVTSAVTTVMWIRKLAELVVLNSKIKDRNGEVIAPELELEKQERLVKKYIMNKCYRNIDVVAYFRDYALFDRDKIEEAIKQVQINGKDETTLDNLTAVAKVIAEKLFKLQEF
ncbi:MAG: hypothetical protein SOY42_10150 [Clostridium sp.]|nr:hypothetical protein [Clostridium sp.]